MLKTFRKGGVHPHDNKLSAGCAIEAMPLPATVTIPLSQHIGAPATPCVVKGDKVKAGQLIGTSAGFVSANVHSSVSGTVTSVEALPDAGGIRRPAVVISVEGDQWDESIDISSGLAADADISAAQIIDKITAAGIVGMGGATFPTQVKLSVPTGKKAEILIINGVECEPYLTSDHRVMLERGREMIAGAGLLAKALGVQTTYIGIENNKKDAIGKISELASLSAGIEVVPLKVKYPQGGEKQLIAAITGREVPSGALPLDVGVVVQNVSTALAVYEAVRKNKPLVERVVTVTGKGLARPSNLLVRVGTPIRALIEHCGGLSDSTGKVVGGGPMMGRAMSNLDAPVTKGTSGILLMEGREAKRRAPEACIKCARCVAVCPMGLEPYMLYKLGSRLMFPEMEAFAATDCIECGSCSFACPASLPLLDYIRLGKGEVMKILRARKQ